MCRTLATTDPQIVTSIANGESETPWIEVRDFRSGAIHFPSGTDGAKYKLRAATDDQGANAADVGDASGVELTDFVTGRWLALPSAVARLAFVKIKTTNSGGAAVNQTADREILLTLKS